MKRLMYKRNYILIMAIILLFGCTIAMVLWGGKINL